MEPPLPPPHPHLVEILPKDAGDDDDPSDDDDDLDAHTEATAPTSEDDMEHFRDVGDVESFLSNDGKNERRSVYGRLKQNLTEHKTDSSKDSLLKKQAVYGPERKLHVAISLQMEKLLLSARQYKKAVLWNMDTLQTESTLKTDYAYFYERRKKRRLTSDFVVQIRTASPLFERLHRSLANMGTLFVMQSHQRQQCQEAFIKLEKSRKHLIENIKHFQEQEGGKLNVIEELNACFRNENTEKQVHELKVDDDNSRVFTNCVRGFFNPLNWHGTAKTAITLALISVSVTSTYNFRQSRQENRCASSTGSVIARNFDFLAIDSDSPMDVSYGRG
ncbi:hypothetical protein DCAR_0518415 [Daucus carota subsp. sativus]|uniref:Uncharacterized protein n=1 Tax=Daucus carota subsp. sativus TaxID=79200 RepID=A0A164X883_DAUCS|nr:hypothetical protein DCAR_0518415 [Daucus carota subsp. sativus]